MDYTPKNSNLSVNRHPFHRLYELRRSTLGALNTRNRVTMIYVMIIITILSAAFANRSESIDHWQKYIDTHPQIKLLDLNEIEKTVLNPVFLPCDDRCAQTGIPQFSATKTTTALKDLNAKPAGPPDSRSSVWSAVTFRIPSSYLKSLDIEGSRLALGLPAFRYRAASVAVNGTSWQRHYDSERVVVRATRGMFLDQDLVITVTMQLPDSGIIYDELPISMPAYFSTVTNSRNLERFLQYDKDTRGSVISIMSRVLIAFFAVFIFLVIDSTPESFGLAMFLGSEAVALVVGEGWLDIPGGKFVMHTFYQMGDIFRLYFFIQMSRLFKPHTMYWLIGATFLSVPYGYFRLMETHWGLSGLDMIPRFRDLAAGCIGTLLCAMAFFSIRQEKLPWRKAALILAAACSFQQVLGPLSFYFPEWNNSSLFKHFFTSYESLYSYFGALSALTNISTLENRVSRLSQARAHGEMIENELALGQTVQRSFMTTPKLPAEFQMSQAHDAAVYVSGDIFYMDWNESQKRLVLLMCDVTGHGVQAALKATACFMLARNIWAADSKPRAFETPKDRFDRFRSEQLDLMKVFSDTPDIPTFSCIELFPETETYYSYRTNFNAPLVVEPTAFGGWHLRSEALRDGVTKEHPLRPGSLIVLFSDGYVGTSRHLMRLTRYIDNRLTSFDGSPEALKQLIAAFDLSNPDRPEDDRTMVVISWKKNMAKFASRWNPASGEKAKQSAS